LVIIIIVCPFFKELKEEKSIVVEETKKENKETEKPVEKEEAKKVEPEKEAPSNETDDLTKQNVKIETKKKSFKFF